MHPRSLSVSDLPSDSVGQSAAVAKVYWDMWLRACRSLTLLILVSGWLLWARIWAWSIVGAAGGVVAGGMTIPCAFRTEDLSTRYGRSRALSRHNPRAARSEADVGQCRQQRTLGVGGFESYETVGEVRAGSLMQLFEFGQHSGGPSESGVVRPSVDGEFGCP